MFRRSIAKMAAVPKDMVWATGTSFRYKQPLQERTSWLCLASNASSPQSVSRTGCKLTFFRSGHDQFILKDIPELIFDHFNEEIRPNLGNSPFIRLPADTIPSERIFVFEYLKEDLLSLVRKHISMHATKKILKDILRGLVEMHNQDIIHLGEHPLSTITMPKLTNTRHQGRQHHG
jgi:hypothetical protein